MEKYNAVHFISLVRDNPILYDLRHPAYMNHYRKRMVWENIARNFYPRWDHMHQSERESAVDTLKKKWRHMRDNYRRELRLQTKEGGSGAPRRRVYIYFQTLDFLRQRMEMCPSESTLDVSEDNTENEEKIIPDVTMKTEIIEYKIKQEVCDQCPVYETSVAVEPSNTAPKCSSGSVCGESQPAEPSNTAIIAPKRSPESVCGRAQPAEPSNIATIAPKRRSGSVCGGAQPARKRYRSRFDLLQEQGQALQNVLEALTTKDKFKESPFYSFSMVMCEMMERVPSAKALDLQIKILQLIADATVEDQAPMPQQCFSSIC